jgi:transcriptional regulator with XRE-family HTH domain
MLARPCFAGNQLSPYVPSVADLRSVVAGNIRAERARARLRQIDLAEVLHLSQPAMSALEAGQRDITLSEALAICRVLETPLAKLLEGAEPEDLEVLGI